MYLSFTETDYTVNEGDDIATVCLEVAANGTTKTLIWLNLYTEDSSAIRTSPWTTQYLSLLIKRGQHSVHCKEQQF